MFTKAFAVAITVMFGALALEVVFGVHLGIHDWVQRVLGDSQIHLI